MKTFWIPFTILVALLIALVYNVRYLKEFIHPLHEELASVSQIALREDWQAAERQTRVVYDAWKEKETYLHVTLRHDSLDNVHVLFEEALAYLGQKKIGEYMATNQALIARLELICEMEELTLHNVL